MIIILKIVKKQKVPFRKFYKDNGFPDAKVIASIGGLKDGGSSAFLTYSIYEGPLFKFGKVSVKSLVKGWDHLSMKIQ